jgi:nicotinamide mononucleotide transporter
VEIVAQIQQLPPLEAAAVLFGVAYLALAVRESLWCWPAAFISSALFIVLMAGEPRLYAQVALNVFYAAMAIYGWYQWRLGGRRANDAALAISTWPLQTHLLAIGGTVVVGLVAGWLLDRSTDAAFPYLDSLFTVASIVTTYMVTRKILENWHYWLVVDSLGLYLYWQQELYLLVCLFVLYLVLVVIGLVRWRREWRAQMVRA